MVYSVRRGVSKDQVRHSPFPHIVIRECLPTDYYQQLAATYPGNDQILEFCRSNQHRKFDFVNGTAKQNYRYDIAAFQMLEQPQVIPAIWRDFVAYHSSTDFFREVVDVLGAATRTHHPSLEKTLGKPLSECSTGVRFRSDGDIYLDCQIGINTPATKTSSTRGVHADAPEELFAGLLYFRDPADDTAGGDLEIHRWQDPQRRHFVGSEAEESAAELVDTIAYEANTLVLFLNTRDSLHAVTARAPSPHTRKLVNLVGEVGDAFPNGLFSRRKKKDKAYFANKARRLMRKLRAR